VAETVKKLVKRDPSINQNISSHSFRHTLVAKLRLNKVPERTISKWLGHTKLDTTARYG